MPGMEEKVRAICLALPGVEERDSHGAPAFFAKKQFVHLWPQGHHDHHFPHLWCAAGPGVADELLRRDPARWFRPPYVGVRGWVGLRLDGEVDWDEVAEACLDGFRTVAPAQLLKRLESEESGNPSG